MELKVDRLTHLMHGVELGQVEQRVEAALRDVDVRIEQVVQARMQQERDAAARGTEVQALTARVAALEAAAAAADASPTARLAALTRARVSDSDVQPNTLSACAERTPVP